MSASIEPPNTLTLDPDTGYIVFTPDGYEAYIPESDSDDASIPEHLHPMFLCMVLLGEGRMPAYVRDLLTSWALNGQEVEH